MNNIGVFIWRAQIIKENEEQKAKTVHWQIEKGLKAKTFGEGCPMQ